MLFGVAQRTWVIASMFFLVAFLTISTAHLYIPHEHSHHGSFVTMPFLHMTANYKEITSPAFDAMVVAVFLSNIFGPTQFLYYQAFDGTQLLAYALELFRQLFSSGVLHSKSY